MKKEILLILNSILDEPIEKIEHDTDLRNDLGMDSIQLAQLTVEIEDRYDIDIFADGIVESFGEIIAQLEDNGNS